jgi:bifunctional non-homologous end joining protein LigD
MLAGEGQAPGDEYWALEVKWDGMRAQLRYDGRRVCLRSRPGRDCTDEFPEIAEVAGALGRQPVVLDAELVCLGPDGKPDFAALRNRLGHPPTSRRRPVTAATLMIFDVLHLDGRAVRRLPYAARRELLTSLALDGPFWRTPRHFVGDAERVLAATAELGLEGVVAKRVDAPYREGRSRAWVKHKHCRRERLTVTGWRERDRQLPEFLLARRAPDGSLRPAGSASLGLDVAQRAELVAMLADRELPRGGRRSGTRWAAPGVEVLVDAHGSPTGPLRDPILRAVEVP